MAAVLSRAEGVDRVVTDPSALDEPVDAHAYLMSLPGLLRLTPGEIPTGTYLHPDPALAARWSAEVALECEELPSAGVGAPIVALV